MGAKVLQSFPGRALVGQRYEGPIFPEGPHGATSLGDSFPIVTGDFVTTEDGTEIVHIAPAFGEDDLRVAAESRVDGFDPTAPGTLFNPVRPDGTFDRRVRGYEVREYEGRVVRTRMSQTI